LREAVLWDFSRNPNSFSADVQVAFGDCEFDSVGHVLRRHGRSVALSPRAFRLLEVLLDRRPEVLSKADLLEHLWPGTFVSDASLHNLVTEVRAAIGDTPHASRFIRTVPRIGYSFHGNAHDAATATGFSGPPAAAHLTSKRREWRLFEGPNLIGRDHDCAVSVDSPSVSRRHARMVVEDGNATVEDLGSKNGTYVNGERVKDVMPVADGSELQIGSVRMVYRRLTALATTVTQRQRKA
jgi:DNA-binding winged helix-turn-helix (wHTH) protein